MTRLLLLAITIVLLGAAVTTAPTSTGMSFTCSTDNPHAGLLRRVFQTTFEVGVDSLLYTVGLAVRPDTVILITNDATCATVIAGHNVYAATLDSAMMVTDSAVVLQAGTSYLVEPPGFREVFVYDSTLSPKGLFSQFD